MQHAPDAGRAAIAPRSRRALRRIARGIGVLLALFITFEVGIRHVPPDGMTVRYDTSTLVPASDGSFTPRFTHTTYTYALPKDRQTIDATYASLNNGGTYNPTLTTFHCTLTSAPWPSSIEFTWHGILLETWWTGGGCADVIENAGGISDTFMLIRHFWTPPWDGVPLPAPK